MERNSPKDAAALISALEQIPPREDQRPPRPYRSQFTREQLIAINQARGRGRMWKQIKEVVEAHTDVRFSLPKHLAKAVHKGFLQEGIVPLKYLRNVAKNASREA